jgi:hypothetical protein
MTDQLAGLAEISALYPIDSRDETVAAGAGVDIKDLDGNLLVLFDAEAGTGTSTPTLSLDIQHRADSADSWAAIPAAALYDPATGAAATFDDVTDADATQVLALKRELLKAEVRGLMAITGTTPDFLCAAYLVGLPKYSSGW